MIATTYRQSGRKGLDITGQYGEPVRAAAAGKVVYSGQGLIGYGNLVIVKHDVHFLSAYGSNSRILVREGEEVRMGQQIAEVGLGAGKQPVLHFEIRKNGKPVNPLVHLPKP
jgi:lipoprotein NlpD